MQGVAFARSSEGQLVARGTAERLDYRREGGRLEASRGSAIIHPTPGTSLATYGTIRVLAQQAEGEVPNARGTARGGVRFDTARGDSALTDRVALENNVLKGNDPVAASGPGYRVNGNGFSVRTDGTQIRVGNGVRGQLKPMEPAR